LNDCIPFACFPVQNFFNTPALLLVGGLGTRLRSLLPSTPKPLAAVGKKSFLELLIRQLRSHGISRLVLCTGYMADQIEGEFGDGRDWDVAIEYSKEQQPMGTAGAVKLAQRYLDGGSDFLVMNGDSFVEVDFYELVQFHRCHKALASLAVARVDNASRYGTVCVDAGSRVVRFMEKTGSELPGLISAGVYVFNRALFDHIPEGLASLEKDVFPQLINQGLYALPQNGMFIDIGTPEDYSRAQQLCDQLYNAALSKVSHCSVGTGEGR
jgi:D-glycero-alpha-D-manno-heptose 1-phosphate guanylyltransferase